MPSCPAHYGETLGFLYGLQRHGIKLGLKNSRALMHILGEPHRSFRSVHVAGTNGKGSTASMIASVLQGKGLKVGLYTSPHLASFTERIRINNIPLTEPDVIELTSGIRKTLEGSDISPTFFEFVTAMAFHCFRSRDVDWAVIEAGMGGRLDATNVISPEVSVITNIGLDHTEFLGPTVREIAREKAGIIKPSVPVVTTAGHTDAVPVLEETANGLGSELYLYGRDFSGSLICMDEEHVELRYESFRPSGPPVSSTAERRFSVPLTGGYQLFNACAAIKACEVLSGRGLHIPDAVIRSGLASLRVEGRFEIISRDPLIIIDSAHNPGAARALSEAIARLFPSCSIIAIIGIMKDKDIRGVLEPILKISDTVILTRPKGERAASPEHLKEAVTAFLKEEAHHYGEPFRGRNIRTETSRTVAEALGLARELLRKDGLILVTGSFYTTGEVKELLCHPAGIFSQLRE